MTPDAAVELAVVMPAYNEEAAIEHVLREWWDEIGRHTAAFRFLLLEDGSTDRTLAILGVLQAELGRRLLVERRGNRGHGQACLAGYRWAEQLGARHILQIDCDGQCDPRYFASLWALRDVAPVVYGRRVQRDDGLGRVLASRALRVVVRWVAGARCTDPNVPYRLMRTSAVAPFLTRVPPDFDLANVAFAVLIARAGVPWRSVPIRFRSRQAGRPSVRLPAFLGKAIRLVRQLRRLR